MKPAREILIAERSGTAFTVQKGRRIRVIDVEGGQVADFVSFNRYDKAGKLSTAVTIDSNGSILAGKGDTLFSNLYNPMLEISEDTVGRHDLLFPACSPPMYRRQYGITEDHPSCSQNLAHSLAEYGITEELIPNPFNIFMNSQVSEDGRVYVRDPLSAPGDYIELTALMDLVVAVSACCVEESRCNAGRCGPIRIELF